MPIFLINICYCSLFKVAICLLTTIFYLSFSIKHIFEVTLDPIMSPSSCLLLLMFSVREVELLDFKLCLKDLHLNWSEGAADEHLLILSMDMVSTFEFLV